MRFTGILLLISLFASCNTQQKKNNIPVIGFADHLEDNTLKQATTGFFDALKKNGYSEEQQTIKVIYRNAQGDIPTLTQIIKYFTGEKVDLIATNPSIATITAIQNTNTIPVFMMVSPTPELMKVTDANGKAPDNLFGVGEELWYIDTSFSLITKLVHPKQNKLRIGMMYNQSEPQSVEALNRIKMLSEKLNVELIYLPVNTSADAQLVTQSLLNKNLDAFFANPDNIVFASFETIINACNKANVPVFTSEAGLVARGAVAAFGADMYQWGYDAGEQAAQYLKQKNTNGLQWKMVSKRISMYNEAAAKKFNITLPSNFEKR